ncbi:MAG: glycosyltransferase family 4 protein [Bacteroidia bacterium]
MKIAINARLLLPNKIDGISRFGYEILKRWVKSHPNVTFHFLFDRQWAEEMIFGENVVPHIVAPPLRHPFLWYAGFHVTIPLYLKRLKADAFFSPEFYLPMGSKLPKIAVFHDLDYEIRPQDVPSALALRYYQHFFPKYGQAANHVISVSNYTKQNLIERYHIEEQKITVAYNGCDAHFFHPISEAKQQQIRAKYADGKPFFHFTGTIQPRKNIENLLLAFDAFKKNYSSDIQLLLVGKQGWKTQSAMETYQKMEHKDAVKFTGFVSDEDLAAIHASSLGLCLVSFLEGFGIPAVEAMNCASPIIAANTGALPEVCGQAALFASPHSPEEIQHALFQLATNPTLRQELIEKGQIQKERFSWDKSAAVIWAEMEKLCAS